MTEEEFGAGPKKEQWLFRTTVSIILCVRPSAKLRIRPLPGASLSRFGEKVTKEPTKGILELPLETPFPLEPPGPLFVTAWESFGCILPNH